MPEYNQTLKVNLRRIDLRKTLGGIVVTCSVLVAVESMFLTTSTYFLRSILIRSFFHLGFSEAPRFQFMAGAQIAQKPLKLTYIHAQKRNTTLLEGSLSLDARNKVTGAYSFNTHKGSLKYTYVHGSGTTLEPSYDFGTEAWHFTAFKKVSQHDTARCGFDAHHNTVGLEWTRDSKEYGQFKIMATVPTDTSKTLKLVAEKTWSVDF
uniref:Uncharacterized protein n=1 Tax=Physcomitrium patens TaxID=3218 RepID=A0A7I4EKJ2_PHYPA|nr:outer envelope pore protein 24B, chloroplastic-like isoform X2 [Physcomitrium patens]|eukprot:XP_024385265.1 outer envelope pore protein 24B, chloroplastic-like isoform X2 [Physcomitrella patens]